LVRKTKKIFDSPSLQEQTRDAKHKRTVSRDF
jgi:hypothetical protein